MFKLFLLVQVIFCKNYIYAAPRPASKNDVGTRPGFSSACRGAKSIGQMVTDSEVVVEAGVVAVSPVRNNIYAVTLKIDEVVKDSPENPSKRGQRLQLLFMKPAASAGPQLRSLPAARSFLEACIYEMDLKVGKKYNLFLAKQRGKLTGKARMVRYVMTGPPILVSKKSRRRVKAAACNNCVSAPKILKLEGKKSTDGKNVRLICRTQKQATESSVEFSWLRDGKPVKESDNMKIKNKRYKSVLVLSPIRRSDSGVYSCRVNSSKGSDTKSYRVAVAKKDNIDNSIPKIHDQESDKVKTKAPPSNPAADVPCPMDGYCLNGGTCSFIPWLGEMSCACAPGYQGARCERKTTSALYSSYNIVSGLCLFGIANPYHPC